MATFLEYCDLLGIRTLLDGYILALTVARTHATIIYARDALAIILFVYARDALAIIMFATYPTR